MRIHQYRTYHVSYNHFVFSFRKSQSSTHWLDDEVIFFLNSTDFGSEDNAQIHSSCSPQAKTKNCAFYYVLPCDDSPCDSHPSTSPSPSLSTPPSTSPSTLDCYTGPVIEVQDGTCSYSMEPITIKSMHGDKVIFTVANNWTGAGELMNQVAVRLPVYPSTDYSCWNSYDVESGAEITKLFEATCTNGIAEIEVYVSMVETK